MNAELRRDPGTEGPLFSRDPRLRHKVHEVEIEMNKKLYNPTCPLPCHQTHTPAPPSPL